MSRRLIVKPEAETDITDGYSWYQARQAGLGESFIEELEAACLRIVENPAAYQEIAPDIRRAVTRIYPYLVFYTVENEDLYILAVLPAAQDPRYIRSRLRGEIPSSDGELTNGST